VPVPQGYERCGLSSMSSYLTDVALLVDCFPVLITFTALYRNGSCTDVTADAANNVFGERGPCPTCHSKVLPADFRFVRQMR
jgi:hypothetical protein